MVWWRKWNHIRYWLQVILSLNSELTCINGGKCFRKDTEHANFCLKCACPFGFHGNRCQKFNLPCQRKICKGKEWYNLEESECPCIDNPHENSIQILQNEAIFKQCKASDGLKLLT